MIARDGVALVTKSSVPYRVAKNTHQGDDHIVAKAQRAGSWRDESPVIYASGARSDMFFADAVRSDDGYVVAVFAQGSPPWLDGLAIARSFDDEANQAAYCPRCDRDFETMAKPCPKCGDLPHFGPGGCGKCSCGPKVAATTNCNGCGFPRTPAEWTAGGEFCDECMGI